MHLVHNEKNDGFDVYRQNKISFCKNNHRNSTVTFTCVKQTNNKPQTETEM